MSSMDRKELLLNVLNVLTPVVRDIHNYVAKEKAQALYEAVINGLDNELLTDEDNTSCECEKTCNGNLTFGEAVEWMKRGMRVNRVGWNSDNFVFLEENAPGMRPHLVVNNEKGCFPFNPGADSILTEDWQIV